MKNINLEIYKPEMSESVYIPLSDNPIHAGFPSPAENYQENKLDLNKALIKNPSSTFFARVKGESMIEDGIEEGDLLIIDKSVDPYDNCMAVCFLDGEFTLKRVKIESDSIVLIPANKKFKTIRVDSNNEFLIWGVVRYLIKKI
jgi:DNA polymerase V